MEKQEAYVLIDVDYIEAMLPDSICCYIQGVEYFLDNNDTALDITCPYEDGVYCVPIWVKKEVAIAHNLIPS